MGSLSLNQGHFEVIYPHGEPLFKWSCLLYIFPWYGMMYELPQNLLGTGLNKSLGLQKREAQKAKTLSSTSKTLYMPWI